MRANTTKAKLKAGQAVFGCFVRYPDASLIEFLGYTGWDFLVFDAEHGPIEPRDCENMVRAAELRSVTPVVRVPTNHAPTILRFMDSGAHGLHVPWVNSVAEAEAAVRAVKYQPEGARGLAGVRAAEYGQAGTLADYVREANAQTLVAVHVETGHAVDQVSQIATIAGIDVVFIGPTDLSHSLGVAGQPQHPSVQEAMQRVADAVLKSPAALGIMVTNAAAARQWRGRGARYITVGLESVLAPAGRDYLTAARA